MGKIGGRGREPMTAPPDGCNELFRSARRSRGLSRERLADAVNQLDRRDPDRVMTAQAVGRIEQGVVRWPHAARREALRVVLGVRSDREIGLFDPRRR